MDNNYKWDKTSPNNKALVRLIDFINSIDSKIMQKLDKDFEGLHDIEDLEQFVQRFNKS